MPAALRFRPLDAATRAELVERYNHAADPETRTRFQIVFLATEEHRSVPEIAQAVLRRPTVVYRVLRRFRLGGLNAVPRRTAPGRQPVVSQEWQRELLRVIEDDPHLHGVDSANWTTQLLADDLARMTGLTVEQETVRRYLHRFGYVCKRPTWTIAHKAAERGDWVGNACGWRSC